MLGEQRVLMVHVPHGVHRRLHPDFQFWIAFHQFKHRTGHRQDATVGDRTTGTDIGVSLENLRESLYHAGGDLSDLLVSVTGEVAPAHLRVFQNRSDLLEHFIAY